MCTSYYRYSTSIQSVNGEDSHLEKPVSQQTDDVTRHRYMRDGRTRWAGDEASAFAKGQIFCFKPDSGVCGSSKGVHPLQNMVANNRPKIEFFSEAQKNERRDL